MMKKTLMGFLIFSTSMLFGMSLSQLNSASKEELMQINGIGKVKAEAIIKERKKGKFKSFEDLQRVEGIGAQTAANVKNDVKSNADVKKVKKTAKKKSLKKQDKLQKKVKKPETPAKKKTEKKQKSKKAKK
jgi:competence protein ComEA